MRGSWLRALAAAVQVMTLRSVTRLAALCAVFALLVGAPAGAQMRGSSSSQHESGATACSGHGNTNFDRCFCDPGWSGAQCATLESEPNCGAHGKASYGKCRCQAGWKGAACETAPLVCVHGKAAGPDKCACEAGWSGAACDDRL
jgi:hypothetical protein